MKKSILLLSLLAITFYSFGQGVPNGSFETWTPFAASGGTGEYPTGWVTTDSITKANGGVQSAWKGTDFFDGAFSLHLKTSQITYFGFQLRGPAIATNGLVQLVGSSFVFSGGSPEINRPRYYSGNYKYSQGAVGDSGEVSVVLYRRNPGTGSRDTIAAGILSITPSVNYSPFLVQMNYRDFVNAPDTCFILLQSSIGTINGSTVALNSELVVDSMNVIGTVGIDETNSAIKSLSIFPNPSSDFITIEAELTSVQKLSFDIFDNRGRWIRSGKMATNRETIEVADLSIGQYVLKLNGNGKPLSAKSFTISK